MCYSYAFVTHDQNNTVAMPSIYENRKCVYLLQLYHYQCFLSIYIKEGGKGTHYKGLRIHQDNQLTIYLAESAYGSMQLLLQLWICVPGTHYNWVD